MSHKNISANIPVKRFFVGACVSLQLAVLVGVVASIQLGWYGSTVELFPLTHLRPIHVTLGIGWIFTAACGGVLFFVPRITGVPLWSSRLGRLQFWLMALTGLCMMISYGVGSFSGREYLNFPIWVSPLVLGAWGCFAVNIFMTIRGYPKRWPVQLWMFATGILLFAWTFLEGHLYLIPGIGSVLPRDLLVQWKSYGALIGSWNMLVYGLQFAVMVEIEDSPQVGHQKAAFGVYLLALVNALFNFGHHVYFVPQFSWLPWVAFLVSMTEMFLLVKIISDWIQRLRSGDTPTDEPFSVGGTYLVAAAAWIILNTTLALLISVPMVNLITHGTEVTVAHAMGSTIGINTMILLGVIWTVLRVRKRTSSTRPFWRMLTFWGLQGALLIFWGCLLIAGFHRGISITLQGSSLSGAIHSGSLYMKGFVISGGVLSIFLILVTIPIVVRCIQRKRSG